MTTRIVIAGGGIAGLCTALALHDAGYDEVTVLERARTVQPLGSGINVMPQAVRELDRLGLLDDLSRISVPTSGLIYATAGGERIWSEPRGADAGFRWPQLSIHRGWLQVELARHVADRLGPGRIVTGAEVIDDPATVEERTVSFLRRQTGAVEQLEYDVLVGADGIRSALRPLVAPADPGPRATWQVVWRGMAWGESFLDGRTMVIGGDGIRKVVFYPLAHRDDDGAALLNWAAAEPIRDAREEGNWNLPADPASFAPGFEGWVLEGVDIAGLMLDSTDCFAYPMVDLDPLDSWVADRVVLAGDAAHAMYPVGSNGATQSIIDASALAYALAGHAGPEAGIDAGLAAYQEDRLALTRRVQAANRRQGPEVVVDLAAERVPSRAATVTEAFAPGELAGIAAQYAATTNLTLANADSPYRALEGQP
ncbi:FAD-dependent monooxygenase [Nocardioides speluncae]|uniref:FAD-dependent monooxygenase n=1 Tax=Nocardioides speluncae TaxID=2670337 RepID=UPI000D68DF65|nr:FAD-dependent monooxygenase [Nocardioides speluncae]